MIMIIYHFYSVSLSTTTIADSEALPTTARIGYCIGVSRQAHRQLLLPISEGPYMAPRAGVEPTTLRLKVIESTRPPPPPITTLSPTLSPRLIFPDFDLAVWQRNEKFCY